MKRIGYLHEQVYDIENIEIADDKARKNKSIRWGIVKHDRNRQNENERLSEQLGTWYMKPLNIVPLKYMNLKKG